jgi:hypothetical protein
MYFQNTWNSRLGSPNQSHYKPFNTPQNSGINKNQPPKKASKNYILEKPENIINTYVRVTNEQF